MRKLCTLLLIVGFVVSSLFASGAREAAETDLSAPVTLTIWTHEDPNRSVFEKELIDEFMAENPNVTVDYQTYPSGKMAELLTVAFSAGEGPDIFNQSQSVIRQFVEEGLVSGLNPEWIGEESLDDVYSRYIPGSLEAVTLDDGLYGLPLDYTNLAIYVNKNQLLDAVLDPETDYPKTWEELMDVSEKLVLREGEIITRRGFDFRYSSYYLMEMLPMVEQLGGKLVSDDGKTAIIGDEAWLRFFDYMREWGPNGRNLGSPTYVGVSSIMNNNDNQLAMSMSGLYQEARIRANNPEYYESGEWMVVPFPQWEDAVENVTCHVSCHYYMVNGSISEAKQVWAWRLIDFMLSHSEGYLEKCSLVQPTYALFESELFKSMPYSEVFKNDLEHATLTYYSANSNAIRDKMKQAVEAVMLEGKDSQTVLEDFRRQVQDLLDDQNF